MNYTNPTRLDIGLQKNNIPTQKKMQTSVLMPFEHLLRCEVDRVLQERNKRALETSSKWHSEEAREVADTLDNYLNEVGKQYVYKTRGQHRNVA